MVPETTTQACRCKSSHRQYINEWVCLGFIKILSTKTSIGLWANFCLAIRHVFKPYNWHIKVSLWQSYPTLRLSPRPWLCVFYTRLPNLLLVSWSSPFTSPSINFSVAVVNGFVTFLRADVQHYLSSVDVLFPALQVPLPFTPATFVKLVLSIQN